MRKSKPQTRSRARAKPNADLLREIGSELVKFLDGPAEGAFDFGEPVEITEMSRRERMMRLLWAEALDGNLKAMQMILDYTDGRPVKAIATSAAVRFTADDYAQADKLIAAWHALQGSAAPPGDIDGDASTAIDSIISIDGAIR
jgi:hypothetical protein